MKPKVSIIFPNYNGRKDTLICLRCLSQLSYPQKRLEVIMVDNGSTDDSVETVKKRSPKTKIIPLPQNLGFAAAVNKGIKVASGNFIFIINNDIIFNKDFLTLLIDYLEKNPEVGITGGKIYYQKPKNKILFSGIKFNPWTGSISRLPHPNQIKESEWIQACAMLVKRQVIDKIGLLDEGFFYTFEDLDFCQRAKRAGFKIIYYPKAVAWHKEGATIDKEGFRKKAFELYKAKFYYLFKNCTLAQIITSTLAQFLFVVPYRKFIKKDQYFFIRPMFSGYFYNLKHLPKIIKKRIFPQHERLKFSFTPRAGIFFKLLKAGQLAKAANYWATCFNMVTRPLKVFSYPTTVVIDSGNVCNLHCALCITGQRDSRRPPALLSFEDFQKIIDQVGRFAYQLDLYNWGEPLLNKDFFKMVTYAKKRWRLRVAASSNLVLLTPAKAEKMINSGLDHLIVSLAGASPKTTKIYMKDGNFNQVIKNLKLLVKLKKKLKSPTPKITWRMLINKYNEVEAGKATQLAKKLGLNEFEPLPLRLSIGYDPDEIIKNFKKKAHWLPKNKKYQAYKLESRQLDNRLQDCFWPWEITSINADGTVQPCCVFTNPAFDFGNIFKTPFKKIWNGPKYQRAREVVKKKIKTDRDTICGLCVASNFIAK